MTVFSGSAFYLAWVWGGGTIPPQGDSYEPTLILIESTAGSDSFREYIGGIGGIADGGDIKFSLVMQTAGTAPIYTEFKERIHYNVTASIPDGQTVTVEDTGTLIIT